MKIPKSLLLALIIISASKSFDIADLILQQDDMLTCKPGLPFPWKMLASEEYQVNTKQPKTTFKSHCFDTTTVQFFWEDDMTVKLYIDSADRKHWLCSDNFLISHLYGFEIKVKVFEGRNIVHFKIHNQKEKDFIENMGLKVMPLCDHMINLIPDIFLTLATFLTEIIPEKEQSESLKKWSANYNWHVMHRLIGMPLIERTGKQELGVDFMKSYVESGDSFCRNVPTGLSLLENWPTGGQCEHVGMFLWGQGDDKNTLYVLESSRWGIRKTEISEWYQVPNINDDAMFAILKLSDEARASFSADKAWAAYTPLEGLPYGYENFLFAAIDTPNDNYPQLINGDSFFSLVMMLDKIPEVNKGLDLVFGQGFNKRLGTEGLKLPEILEEATKKGMSINELFAIPEDPNWIYGEGDKKGMRFVCSGLVAYLLSEGGALGDVQVTAQEFTPKDVWNLDIWSRKPPHPDCLANDFELPFCQIKGYYYFTFNDWNIIKPYSNMNERCASKAPSYVRRPADC